VTILLWRRGPQRREDTRRSAERSEALDPLEADSAEQVVSRLSCRG